MLAPPKTAQHLQISYLWVNDYVVQFSCRTVFYHQRIEYVKISVNVMLLMHVLPLHDVHIVYCNWNRKRVDRVIY